MWGRLEGLSDVTITLARTSFDKTNWSYQHLIVIVEHEVILLVQNPISWLWGSQNVLDASREEAGEKGLPICERGSRNTNATLSFNSPTPTWRRLKERQPPLILITLFGNFSSAPTWLLSISADSFLLPSSLQAGSHSLLLINTQVRDLCAKIGGINQTQTEAPTC